MQKERERQYSEAPFLRKTKKMCRDGATVLPEYKRVFLKGGKI